MASSTLRCGQVNDGAVTEAVPCCADYIGHLTRVAGSSSLIVLRTAKRELSERVSGGMQMSLGEVQIDGRVFQPLMPHE